jgi:hypothetical protein
MTNRVEAQTNNSLCRTDKSTIGRKSVIYTAHLIAYINDYLPLTQPTSRVGQKNKSKPSYRTNQFIIKISKKIVYCNIKIV